MATIKKSLVLGKTKQLLDLNEDSINFQVEFEVKSKNGSDFEGVVSTQTSLDSNTPLEYKLSQGGVFSGRFVQNTDVYQNFYLILKSETQCEVDLEIVKLNIPLGNQNSQMNEAPLPPQPTQGYPQQSPQGYPQPIQEYQNKGDSGAYMMKESGFNFKILIAVAVIGGIAYALYYFSKKQSIPPSIPNKHPPRFIASSPSARSDNNLLEQLKNLNF